MNRPRIALVRGDALDATGSIAYSVAVDGLPVGYVGDSRELGRAGRLVRRWFACLSLPGDPATVPLWDSGTAYRTRAAAVAALVDHARGVAR
ncbi:hypothetical protein ACWGPQ_07190 [Saccharomonospora azurea]